MNPLLKGFCGATRPTDRRSPWQWCEDNVVVDQTSSMSGPWRLENSPWVKPLMEAAGRKRVKKIVVKCSAQSSKTQTILCLSSWAIAEDPGPALWVMANKDDAEDFLKDRVAPTFSSCAPVKKQFIESKGLTWRFASMPFYFTGAGSKAKLQSKPIRWLFLDEVRNYPPGALSMVLKRTRSFWNSKTFIISTPDKEGDTVDLSFKEGNQITPHFTCPECSKQQAIEFENIKWDTNEETKPRGTGWVFDKLAPTIRLECVGCGRKLYDTPENRRWLLDHLEMIPLNPDAPESVVSITWSALIPSWVTWRSVVEEFLNAQIAARSGSLDALKTFYNETLGKSWKDQMGELDDFDFLGSRLQGYDFGETWAEERARFISADKQESGGEHYWYVVRAFGPFGKSRLITYGRCNTKAELEELRIQHGVPQGNAMIDSGFKASEVYRFCASNGWKAFKGDDPPFFLVHTKDAKGNTKTVRMIWRKTMVDPHFGTAQAGKFRPIPLFQFSNDSTKDLLAEYMTGLVGEWTLPRGVGRDYLKQVSAEKRVEDKDTKGRPVYTWKRMRRDNHLWDCELQILVAAVITKVVATPGPSGKASTPGTAETEAAPAAASPLG